MSQTAEAFLAAMGAEPRGTSADRIAALAALVAQLTAENDELGAQIEELDRENYVMHAEARKADAELADYEEEFGPLGSLRGAANVIVDAEHHSAEIQSVEVQKFGLRVTLDVSGTPGDAIRLLPGRRVTLSEAQVQEFNALEQTL